MHAYTYIYTYLDLPIAMASVALAVRQLTLVMAQVVPWTMDCIAPPTAFVPGRNSPLLRRDHKPRMYIYIIMCIYIYIRDYL